MLSGEEQSEYPRSNMDSSTTLMNVYRLSLIHKADTIIKS